MDSRDMIEETVLFLHAHELPACCLVNVTWAETSRPLLLKIMKGNIGAGVCTQRLIVEANLANHSIINASLASGGRVRALSSAITGDGKLRCFPPGASSSSSSHSGGGGGLLADTKGTEEVTPEAVLATTATKTKQKKTAAVFDLPAGQQLIGFAECSTTAGAAAGGDTAASITTTIVFGVAVGESLGYGAMLHAWKGDEEEDVVVDKEQQEEHQAAAENHAAASSTPRATATTSTAAVFLEYSEVLSGCNALLSIEQAKAANAVAAAASAAGEAAAGEEATAAAAAAASDEWTEVEKALFKCRAFHCFTIPNSSSNGGGGGSETEQQPQQPQQQQQPQEEEEVASPASLVVAVRALVHNSTLASVKKALVGCWNASNGKLMPEHCLVLDWDEKAGAAAAGAAVGTAGATSEGDVTVNDENHAPLPPPPPPSPSSSTLLAESKMAGVSVSSSSSSSSFFVASRFGGVASASVVVLDSSLKNSHKKNNQLVLATGHDRNAKGAVKVRLWDGLSGSLLHTLDGPAGLSTRNMSVMGATQVCVSSDGQWVMAACADGRAHLWNLCLSEGEAGGAAGGAVVAVAKTTAILGSNKVIASADAASKTTLERCQAVALSGGFAIAAFATPARFRSTSSATAFLSSGRKSDIHLSVFELGTTSAPPSRTTNASSTATTNISREPLSSSTSSSSSSYSVPTTSAAAAAQVKSQDKQATLSAVKYCGTLPEVGVFYPPPSLSSSTAASTASASTASASTAAATTANATTAAATAAAASTSATANGAGTEQAQEGQEEPQQQGRRESQEPHRESSVLGGDLRINKICCDLARRGKIVVACASPGANRNGAEVNGFLAEYDFLKLLETS